MFTIIAHADEIHSDGLESIAQTATPWFIALPLFIIIVASIGYLTWLVSLKRTTVVLRVLTVVFLVSGFTLFNISAVVSISSITLGLLLAGFQAYGSLID